MDTLQAILLGIVQGITEFLPVSSSGHLQIAKEVLGVQLEENLTFDVALHAATVLSTIVVLWSEVWRLLKGLFSRRFNEEQAYVLKLVLSMIPLGIVGFLLKDRINDLLNAPYILAVVGAMLLVTAALLAFAYYAKPRQKETISYRDPTCSIEEKLWICPTETSSCWIGRNRSRWSSTRRCWCISMDWRVILTAITQKR